MKQKTCEEIMISVQEYPHIPDTMTLLEAMSVLKMKRAQIKARDGRLTVPDSALVFNSDLVFVGTVRRRDILRGLLPDYLSGKSVKHRGTEFPMTLDLYVSEFSWDRAVEGLREQAKHKIADVMNPITLTVNYNDHLLKAMQQIVALNCVGIPVVKDKKIIGMVRSADLMHEVEQFLNIEGEQLKA
jgi:predicted transcriptional regulator